MRPRLTILLIFLTITPFLKAQQLYFSHLNVNNGLSQGVNNCIYKDSRGFVWVSSFDGLNRFDGLNCRIYRQNQSDSFSIKGTLFLNLLEDKNANLWIGSNQGLNFYDRRLNRFLNYQMPGRSMANQFFSPFYIDDKNRIWLQSNSDIILYNPTTKSFSLKYTFPQSGNMLVQTRPSVQFFPLEEIYTIVNNKAPIYTGKLRNDAIKWIDTISIKNEAISRINCFIPDANNNFWLGTHEGLFFLNNKNNIVKPYQFGNNIATDISAIHIEKSGRFWIGTQQQGLYLTDSSRSKLISHYYPNSSNPDGLSGKQVVYIYADAQQYLWVSVWGKGIDYLSLDKFHFNHLLKREELWNKGIDNFMRSIVQLDNKEIWIATQNSGIIVLNKKKELKEKITQSLPASIEHLLQDRNGLIWAATFSGIYLIDKTTKKVKKVNNPTSKTNIQKNQFNYIYQLQDGRILASGNSGLFVIQKNGNQYSLIAVKNIPANDVYLTNFQDKDGTLYISRSFKGFYTSRIIKDSVSILKDFPYQASIKCYAETKDSILWIGTTIGLMKYNKKSKQINKIYTTNDGLSNQYIYGIIPDKEDLWLSTNGGISRLNTISNEIKNFTAADGLQSNEFNTYSFCKLTSGDILFGGVNGLNSFRPEQLKKDTLIPPISLQSVRINDTIANVLNNPEELHLLDLSYAENTISFQFSVIDYSDPNGCSFLYKLEGYDKDWISSTNNSIIRYANLPPSKYTLNVKAVSAEGLESTNIYSILIKVATPWHKTWWFRFLIFLTLTLFIIIVLKSYLKRQFEKQKVIIEKELAIEQERTRMAKELHDGLGSMLSGIKHSFTAMKNKLTLNKNEQDSFHTNIEKLNDSISEIRNISHSMASDSLLQYGLENSLRDYCRNISQPGELNISFNSLNTSDILLNNEVVFHIFRIVQELLQNIIKHSNAVNALVQLSYNNKVLYLNVEDDGKGFDLNYISKNKGMGLKNIESRIKILKGTIDFKSASNQGTSVMIEIPCKEIRT